MSGDLTPVRIVNSAAPIRICDNGGWTDTWFSGTGKIFNIAVEPLVKVQVSVYRGDAQADRIVMHAVDYGDRYAMVPGQPGPGRHRLLEAAVETFGLPPGQSVVIEISSEAPAGSSTGTSAAAAVALLGAIDALSSGGKSPPEIARQAHGLEVNRLGLQSGIQDQLCSAYGGINYIEMSEYPQASVVPIVVPDPVWHELDRRLTLLFLGRPHVSSAIHEAVIAELEVEGPTSPRLERLRQTAVWSRDALYAADFAALGRAMVDNTDGQADLHPDLVSQDARLAIQLARTHGALGWKVNGAGGDGGSLTLLSDGSAVGKRRLIRALEEHPPFRVIPVRLSRDGLRVWET